MSEARVRRLGVAACSAGLLLAFAPRSYAQTLRVGRFSVIPYGVGREHPVPLEGGGPRRTGRLASSVPSEPPSLRWTATLSALPRGLLIAADGSIYVSTRRGVVAFDRDGNHRWTQRIGDVTGTGGILPSGRIVVASASGRLVVLDRDGEIQGSAELGGLPRGSPLVFEDGSILIGTADRRVHRLDAQLRPVFSVELLDVGVPSLARGVDGRVVAVSGSRMSLVGENGAILRSEPLQGRATVPAAVADDGTIWVVTRRGVLHAFHPSGASKGRTELSTRHHADSAIAIGRGGRVWIPTGRRGVICVDDDGTELWRGTDSAGVRGPIAVDAEGTALLIDRSGALTALDQDGGLRWRVTVGRSSRVRPVSDARGTLYLITHDAGREYTLQAWR